MDPNCSSPTYSCPPPQIIRYTLGPRVSMRLAGPPALQTTRAGNVLVPVSCQARRRRGCKAKVAVHQGRRPLAMRRATLLDGRRRAVVLRLAGTARNRLARGRRLCVRVTATTLSGGERRVHRRSHVLAPP
jgi:hypothetical protein